MAAELSATQVKTRQRALISLVIMSGVAELSYAIVNFSAMPPYLMKMHWGVWIGAIGAAFLLVETLLKSPMGLLSDRFGRKPMLMLGPLISMITAPLTVVIGHPLGLMAIRALDGIGAAALWPTAFATVADAADPKQRATAMSLFNVTYMIGIALGPLLGGLVNDYSKTHHLMPESMHASFYLAGVLFLCTALICYVGVPNKMPLHHSESQNESHVPKIKDLWIAAKMVPDTMLLGFVVYLAIGLVMLLVKLYAMDELHLSETGYGALLLPPAIVFALASVPAGRAADRWGKRRVMCIGMTLCCFGMWMVPFTSHHIWLMIGCTVVGIGYILAIPAWMAIVSNINSERRGAIMGAVFTAQGVGAMIGAPLGSYLYIHASPIPRIAHITPFIGCCILLTVAWIITLVAFNPNKELKRAVPVE